MFFYLLQMFYNHPNCSIWRTILHNDLGGRTGGNHKYIDQFHHHHSSIGSNHYFVFYHLSNNHNFNRDGKVS